MVAGFLILKTWSRSNLGAGLIQLYLITFFVEHWISGIIYTFPWYQPIYDPEIVRLGFYQSFLGLIGFSIGVLWFAPILGKISEQKPILLSKKNNEDYLSNSQIIIIVYITIGLTCYFFLAAATKTIPTLSSIVTQLVYLTHVGFMALYSFAEKKRKRSIQLLLIISIFLFPIVTVVQDGQAWFGVWTFILAIVFILRTSGVKRRYLLVIAPASIIGFSFFVSYFGVRQTIRSVVWDRANTTITERVNTIGTLFDNFELLDTSNPTQLLYFDLRFNQNALTGAAIQRIDSAVVQYAYGTTIADTFLALIPRAVWPDKPIFAGGSATISHYAGISYSEGTSVPAGNVMELYINFGSIGVVLGFILLGLTISILDRIAAQKLQAENWLQFGLWLVPAFSFMSPTNLFVLIIGSAIISVVAVGLINAIIRVVLRSGGIKQQVLFR